MNVTKGKGQISAKPINAILTDWLQRCPDAEFLIDLNRGRVCTVKEVTIMMSGLAELFNNTNKLGNFENKPQTIVAFLEGGFPDAIIVLTALAAGHRLLPLSPEITLAEADRIITQGVTTVIGRPSQATETWQLDKNYKNSEGITFIPYAEMAALLSDVSTTNSFSELQQLPGGGSIALFTSGSTGPPKQVVLPETLLLQSARQIAEVHQLTAADRGLTVLPLYHVNAPVVSLLAGLVSGGQIQVAKRYSSSHFWEWVERYQPTWISLVPAVAIMLLNIPEPAPAVLASVRFIRSASAPLPASTLQAFEQRYKVPVIETYGISEAAATIASNPLPPAAHKAGSVGKPLPGLAIRVCAPGLLQMLPHNTVGEVCVQGMSVIDHYESAADPDSFQDGWFRTGDIGYFDADGYLFLSGRSKDIIICGGENIFPAEIESVLMGYPGIIEAAVIGEPDTILGEKVVAYIACKIGTQAIIKEVKKDDVKGEAVDIASIKQYLAANLSVLKQPTDIRVLPSLPKTNAGKISKPALRQLT